MKKLVFLLSFVLITGTIFAQSGQIIKKDFTLLKGAPTLSLYGTAGVINFNAGDITLTNTSTNLLTLAGGTLALGSNSLTMTGSIAATGSRVTKAWATEVEANILAITAGDTTVTAVVGRIVFKTSDTHFYGCRKTTAKKWYQLDN